jgi:hypothetical protein
MRRFIAVLLALSIVGPALAEDVTEPEVRHEVCHKGWRHLAAGSRLAHKDHCEDKGVRNWPLCG